MNVYKPECVQAILRRCASAFLLIVRGGIVCFRWADHWINANENPRSALTLEEKRRMKERGLYCDIKGKQPHGTNTVGPVRRLLGVGTLPWYLAGRLAQRDSKL